MAAQVSKDCFNKSAETYGLLTGEAFSSIEQLRKIEFDRTMVLNSVTGCFGAKGEIYSIQLITKSTVNGQEFKMPLVGEILGTCETFTLKDGDYGKYLSIHYTSKSVTGLKIETATKE